MDSEYRIERAAPEHLAQLPAIEAAAGRLFLDRGLPESVLADETSPDEFREAQEAGLLWVALRAEDQPVGFAHVELLDGAAHLEELDVHPDHGRRGVGAALVRAVCDWACRAGYAAVTLTTFRGIPWNAPFYERIGFSALDPSQLTPNLTAVVAEEAARGLGPGQRVVMRIETGAG